MRRTKLWWAALTKKERSELHRLECAMSSWSLREKQKQNKCSYCGGSRGRSWDWICPECQNRRNRLIKKANEAIYAN